MLRQLARECCRVLVRQPYEVGLAGSSTHDLRHALPFSDDLLRAFQQFIGGIEGGDRGSLGQGTDRERNGDLVHCANKIRVAEGIAHPHPGQTIGLGKGPQADHIRIALHGLGSHGGILRPVELKIGLIQTHHHISWDTLHESLELFLGEGGAGGVIRIAQENQAGALGDGIDHPIQIMFLGLRQQRDRHSRGTGHAGEDGVGLEAAPREDNLIPVCAGGLHQLLTQCGGTASHRDLFRGQFQVLRQHPAQLDRTHVRVTVGAGGSLGDR